MGRYTKSFAEVFFPAGTRVEFPLFGTIGTYQSIILTSYKRDAEIYTLSTQDYVMAPVFDLGGSGNTSDEAITMVISKIRACCLKVILKAASLNPEIVGKDQADLEKQAVKFWQPLMKLVKPHSFKLPDNKYVIVDLNDNLCIAIREDVNIAYTDPTKPGNYYTWGDFGFVCLDHRLVLSGRIQ